MQSAECCRGGEGHVLRELSNRESEQEMQGRGVQGRE